MVRSEDQRGNWRLGDRGVVGRGAVGVAGLLLAVGMLAGCADASTESGETTAPVESVEADATTAVPVESAPELTDEEALQIAVETYEEYLAISGELIDSQGDSFADLEAITTPNMSEGNQAALEQSTSGEFTTEGVIPVIKSELVQKTSSEIDILLCLDLSQSKTLDANGQQVGPDRTGLTNAVDVRVVNTDGAFKVDRSDQWTQSEFCSA
ncbi:hypothetical protein [Gulosibacter molinativorax]|nr:hypothetical protein [Gulosibacter molinativorax]QUY63407.1 Hypotetical protein [Gulosibacter molinativorax]